MINFHRFLLTLTTKGFWRKNEKEDVSRIMPLTDENKEKNAENLKKARKNDEKTEL